MTAARMFAVGALALSVFAARAQDPPAEESWDARGQATYVQQRKPGFGAAYSGRNSLTPDYERSYTLTATAYLGFRPWQGGELYLDAELTQGLAFSNLTGLAGFTNGEVTRVSGPDPRLYRQRVFLRQTWNQGGGSEKLEPDLNQLASTVDRNRFVLTAGNFALLDVFDGNAYAHDPRSQFMNWGNMTYAAYDYAADSRGFGWGFAAEWTRDDWVLRIGRMTVPREPNQLPLDFRFFKHYGDQVEVEHAHALAGRPGRLRLLAWRNRAVLARYRDAIDLGARTAQAPDIAKVRNGEQIKYGFGFNIEQSISESAGLFLRAMRADGRSETLAFTEADASLAAGVSLRGGAWGRAQDTLGLSALRNFASKDRRDYLAAGGISFFIGDGALRYRPEDIVEVYYSLALAKGASLSIDLQRIAHPAYNADRGPVDFYGLRLHAEF
jgi:high affinity Mn2+ porin